jgi:hypothetical protein
MVHVSDMPTNRQDGFASKTISESLPLPPKSSEATPTVLRRQAIGLHECTTHTLVVAEACSTCYNLDRIICGFEETHCRFDANLLNRPSRPLSGLPKIDASKIPGAHSRRVGQRLQNAQ